MHTMRSLKKIVHEAGRYLPLVLGAISVLAATCHSAAARVPSGGSPEIDPGSIGSAITLFVGGAMYLTSRRRAK
jgi:hypothetical protein